MKIKDLDEVVPILEREFGNVRAPVMDLVAAQSSDPYAILVGTILSARTKDECTSKALTRLLSRAGNLNALGNLSEDEIEKVIYPVGFYHTKAKHLHELPKVVSEKFGGEIPSTLDELCMLPGVGRKTANLVLALAFKKDALCVDVHVHRISNRFGLVKTKTPFETEMALAKVLPKKYWIAWNSLVVAFGQTRCRPINPKCLDCPLVKWCDETKKRM